VNSVEDRDRLVKLILSKQKILDQNLINEQSKIIENLKAKCASLESELKEIQNQEKSKISKYDIYPK
jgi:hypothetical protein